MHAVALQNKEQEHQGLVQSAQEMKVCLCSLFFTAERQQGGPVLTCIENIAECHIFLKILRLILLAMMFIVFVHVGQLCVLAIYTGDLLCFEVLK